MALQQMIVFIDSTGEPLPDWLQTALRPHIPPERVNNLKTQIRLI